MLHKNEFLLIQKHFIKYNLLREVNKIFKKKDLNKLILFMKKDKKNNNNKINLVLLKQIGKTVFDLSFSDKKLRSFVKNQLIN